jgi:hypothetical protein
MTPKEFSEDEKLDILSRALEKHGKDIFASVENIPDQDSKVRELLNKTLFVRKAVRPYSRWLPMAALLLLGINVTLFYHPRFSPSPKENIQGSQAVLSPFAQEGMQYTSLNSLIPKISGELEKAKILFHQQDYKEALHYAALARKKDPTNIKALSLIRDCIEKLNPKDIEKIP